MAGLSSAATCRNSLTSQVVNSNARIPVWIESETEMTKSASQLARECMQAYVDKDRAAAEAIVADDFHFTSPMDNALDRKSYFELCWPNSEAMTACKIVHAVDHGDRAFVTYEATASGRTFRNTEVHTARDGKLIAVEVYFGWNLPHSVASGKHSDPPSLI
jgi:ketosteroid isomerase-like protein